MKITLVFKNTKMCFSCNISQNTNLYPSGSLEYTNDWYIHYLYGSRHLSAVHLGSCKKAMLAVVKGYMSLQTVLKGWVLAMEVLVDVLIQHRCFHQTKTEWQRKWTMIKLLITSIITLYAAFSVGSNFFVPPHYSNFAWGNSLLYFCMWLVRLHNGVLCVYQWHHSLNLGCFFYTYDCEGKECTLLTSEEGEVRGEGWVLFKTIYLSACSYFGSKLLLQLTLVLIPFQLYTAAWANYYAVCTLQCGAQSLSTHTSLFLVFSWSGKKDEKGTHCDLANITHKIQNNCTYT